MNGSDNNNFSNASPRRLRCPQCGELTVYSTENPSRPFCSARCKLIDLGQWADQSYKIPSTTVSIETSNDLEDADDIDN